MLDHYQKIIRLDDFINGLDSLSINFDETLYNDDWLKFFKLNSKLVQNDLNGSLNDFENFRSFVFITFHDNFLKFFEILKIKEFNPKNIFKNFPDLLMAVRENPQVELKSCIIKMIPYMNKFLMPAFQQEINLYEQKTGEEFKYKRNTPIPDPSYVS